MSAPLKETHAGGVVQVALAPGQRFGILPRAIPEDLRLPPDARLVAAWLATQQEGFQVVVSAICSLLGLGKEKWQRIARQLESTGYLSRSCSPTGPSGRWVWKTLFFADASGNSPVAGADLTGAVSPGSGAPGDGGDGNIREQGEEDKNPKRESARAPRAPAGAGPRTPRSARWGLEVDEQNGIHHKPGDARDAQAMARIVTFPQPQVQQAVALAASLDPQGRAFPSQVLRTLLKQQGPTSASPPAWANAQSLAQALEAEAHQIINGGSQWTD